VVTPKTTLDWYRRLVRRVVGVEYHMHDLCHAGLTWAAATGATVVELLHRAGHASPTVAMAYQHATSDRDVVLAAALAGLCAPKAPVIPISAAAAPGGNAAGPQ
jgi:hypothetical protein